MEKKRKKAPRQRGTGEKPRKLAAFKDELVIQDNLDATFNYVGTHSYNVNVFGPGSDFVLLESEKSIERTSLNGLVIISLLILRPRGKELGVYLMPGIYRICIELAGRAEHGKEVKWNTTVEISADKADIWTKNILRTDQAKTAERVDRQIKGFNQVVMAWNQKVKQLEDRFTSLAERENRIQELLEKAARALEGDSTSDIGNGETDHNVGGNGRLPSYTNSGIKYGTETLDLNGHGHSVAIATEEQITVQAGQNSAETPEARRLRECTERENARKKKADEDSIQAQDKLKKIVISTVIAGAAIAATVKWLL